MLLAIDPGNDTGWALFDNDDRLKACGLGDPRSAFSARTPDQVLIECPQLRPRGEKNPNAILKVARNAGEWAGRYSHVGEVNYLSPNDWKGSTPKDVSHGRIHAKLDAREALVVDAEIKTMAPSKRHNVLDAIGIGLHGVGR